MADWTRVGGVANSSSGTTLVLGSIPAGSHIRVRTYSGGAAPTISDDSGDTGAGSYAVAKSTPNTFDGGTLQEVHLYPTVNTASRTITASASCHMAVSWWTPTTGAIAVTVVDSNGACTIDGNSPSVNSGNVTAAIGDLVSGFADNSNSAAADWTAGGTSAGGAWTTDIETTEANHVVYAQSLVATAAGPYSAQPLLAINDAIATGIVVYRATIGGPTTQIVAPVADVSRGAWLAEPGDGTTNLWDQINETVLSATDYVQSSQSPVAADIYKFRIAPLQAPVKPRSNGAFHFRVDALKDVTGGDSMQLTVKLYAADGTTLIKAWTPIAVDAETTTDLTLTGAEADTIPDADFAVGLVLAFEALKV